MNRDRLKYRAWDTKTKKMIATGFHVIGEVTMFNLIEQYCYEHLEGKESVMLRFNDIKLMQCLGLKDKTGKLAYEEDIVKYEEELYKIIWVQEDLHYYLERLDLNSVEENWIDLWNEYNMGDSGVEIVGNVYENPKLLTSKKDNV